MSAGVASSGEGMSVLRLPCGTAARKLRRARRARPLIDELRRRFSAGRARNVRALVEFHVETGDGDVERYRLLIDRGRCVRVRRPLSPTTTIAIALEDLAALVDGREAPAALFMSQRMSVTGDVLLAVRLPDFFSG